MYGQGLIDEVPFCIHQIFEIAIYSIYVMRK